MTSTPAQTCEHAYGPAPSQFGRLHVPDGGGPFPVLMILHGGYWKNRQTLDSYPTVQLVPALVARGVAVWNVEYRRMGEAGGGWPGTLLDAAAALQHLRALAADAPLDLDRVVVLGHSAGGHLACWLAGQQHLVDDPELAPAPDALQPRHVVAVGAIPDLEAAWAGGLGNPIVLPRLLPGDPEPSDATYARASALRLVPPVCPLTLVHGLGDVDVAPGQSRRYHAAATSAGGDVTLVELPDDDHLSMLEPDGAGWGRLMAVLADRGGLAMLR